MVGQARDPNSALAAPAGAGRMHELAMISQLLSMSAHKGRQLGGHAAHQHEPAVTTQAMQRLFDLLRSSLLDISPIRPRVYPLAALPDAMEAAATAGNLEYIVMQP